MKPPNSLIAPIKDLGYVTEYIKESVASERVELANISEAPLWLKIISSRSYCAYKNTIYVPSFHFSLVSSESSSDRNMATAKLCKWFMAIHDFKSVNFSTCFRLLYYNSYIMHYFLYEYFFLIGCEHPYKDLVTLGFMSTRKTWYNKLVKLSIVHEYLTKLLILGTPATPS